MLREEEKKTKKKKKRGKKEYRQVSSQMVPLFPSIWSIFTYDITVFNKTGKVWSGLTALDMLTSHEMFSPYHNDRTHQPNYFDMFTLFYRNQDFESKNYLVSQNPIASLLSTQEYLQCTDTYSRYGLTFKYLCMNIFTEQYNSRICVTLTWIGFRLICLTQLNIEGPVQ